MIASKTNAVSAEQRLLAAIPQLRWTRAHFVGNGWLKLGQNGSKKDICFSRKNHSLFVVSGEAQFLFENEVLYEFGFYVDGDEDFSKLYQELKKILPLGEIRSGNAKGGSRIDWRIGGEAKDYKVGLVRRVFGQDVERSLEIDLVSKKEAR